MTKKFLKLAAGMVSLWMAAGVLSGCATIPTNSAVVQGPDIQNQLTNDYLYYSPAGPVKGESAPDILAGFLNASTGPQNDYGVARQYLLPNFRTTWSPNQKVYIQRGGQKTRIQNDGVASVSLGVSAEVDAQGHYTVASPSAKVTLRFKMVQYHGEWRISEAPNAVVMIRPVFEVIFRSYEVYFFDHMHRFLIPDLRWFPARASTATRLVNALLSGPSPWLANAVGPTVPAGSKLAIDAVTVEKKAAIVNLSAQSLSSSSQQLRWFKGELVATLTQLTGIDSVQIQIDSVPQNISPAIPDSTSSASFAPVILTDRSLQQLVGPSGSRLSNADDWLRQVGATDFAVTADQSSLALVGPRGVYQARLDALSDTPKLIDSRKSLLPPRFDNLGQLWLVGADGRIQIVANGTSAWLAIPWLAKHTISAFDISAEGSRAAFIITDADGNRRLVVAAIVRHGSGLPASIGSPIELSYGVGSPVSLQWSGESDVMVLADTLGGASNINQISIGGDPREVTTLPHAISLMTSSDGTNVYALQGDGRLMEYRGYTWSILADGVKAAHMAN